MSAIDKALAVMGKVPRLNGSNNRETLAVAVAIFELAEAVRLSGGGGGVDAKYIKAIERQSESMALLAKSFQDRKPNERT